MLEHLNLLSTFELYFLIIGFLGQALFASRFIVQWIYSERLGVSSIPIIFWYLSMLEDYCYYHTQFQEWILSLLRDRCLVY